MLPGREIVADFAGTIALPEIEDSRPTLRELNPSLPWFAAQTVQHMWRLRLDPSLVFQAINWLQSHYRDQRLSYEFLSPAEAHAFDMKSAESNRLFRDEFCPEHGPIEPRTAEGDAQWKQARAAPYRALETTIRDIVRSVRP